MSDSVTITSVNDGTRLTFVNVVGESFNAIMENPAFSGRVMASTHHSGPPSLLFSEMAAERRGWQGTKEWVAVDDDLRLRANADLTGHITLVVTMRASGIWADWRLEATLHLEAGQLESLRHATGRFFGQAPII